MYCKTCGKKLEGTEKFCSDCGSPIDYAEEVISREELKAAAPYRESRLDFRKNTFHLDEMDWDLKGYPTEEKKTDIVDFDWASVLEGKEKRDAEERRRAITMSEEDIYDRIQSDRHNDEFDWDLVHTMRIDKAGRSDLSLFHEEDEELFSVDFIPPLNKADSYENMVPDEDEAPTPIKGTVVIDKIDKSGIEAAAREAAGIQERDYDAMGVAQVDATPKNKKKIEKFYTFNRKNEEFQALLDEEYERIRQKVQAETEEEELKNAVLQAVNEANEEAENIEEPEVEAVPLTREEEAKQAAETEADEAERLALEAERIAEEAAAKAKAAEEAAAKAALEAQAAEDALRALEEEEAARIAAEEEAARIAAEEAARKAEEEARVAAEQEAARIAAEQEAARIAAEEEARKAAEEAAAEEAARIAQERAELAAQEARAAEEAALAAQEAAAAEAAAKAEEDLRAAEAAAALAAAEAATRAKAAQLAAEEAAVDLELEKLNESHRALEAAVAEIEAEMQEGPAEEEIEVAPQDRKVSYTDIFEDDDDDDDYEERKGSGCKTLFLDLLIVILVIAVGIAAMLVFLPEHTISQRIRGLLPFGNAPTIQPEEPEETAEVEEAEPEPTPEPEPVLSDIETAISKATALASGFGEVSEDKNLLFASGTDYGMEGVDIASVFTNEVWFKSASGDSVTYVDSVVSSVLEYYQKLVKKLNEDDPAVLELVGEDSPLYGELSAVSANPDIQHTIEKIQFGEMRSNGTDFYALVKVTEKLSSEDSSDVTDKLIYLQADNDAKHMKVINIVDVQ